jgi:hypothetical protein
LLESWARIEAKKVAKMLLEDVIHNLETLKYPNDLDTQRIKITNETIDLCVTKIRQDYGLEPRVTRAADFTDSVAPKTQPSISPSIPFIKPVEPVPYTPVIPVPYTPVPVPTERSCEKCGIQLSPVMNYSCPRPACPTGLGGIHY